MPSATSRAMEPVGIVSIGALARWPSRMTEPLPKFRSIWARAASSAFSRSLAEAAMDATFDFDADALTVPTVDDGSDKFRRRARAVARGYLSRYPRSRRLLTGLWRPLVGVPRGWLVRPRGRVVRPRGLDHGDRDEHRGWRQQRHREPGQP